MPISVHRLKGVRSARAPAPLISPAQSAMRSVIHNGGQTMNRSPSMLSIRDAWSNTAGRWGSTGVGMKTLLPSAMSPISTIFPRRAVTGREGGLSALRASYDRRTSRNGYAVKELIPPGKLMVAFPADVDVHS